MSEGFLSLIAFHFPETVPFLSEFYSTVDKGAYNATDVQLQIAGQVQGTERQSHLLVIGSPVIGSAATAEPDAWDLATGDGQGEPADDPDHRG